MSRGRISNPAFFMSADAVYVVLIIVTVIVMVIVIDLTWNLKSVSRTACNVHGICNALCITHCIQCFHITITVFFQHLFGGE